MILFNWDAIVNECGANSFKILDKFKAIGKHGVPKNLSGNSYMLNLPALLASKASSAAKFDYIALAALRNYFDLEYQRNAGLFVYYSPVAPEKLLKNKLFTIENDYIYFKYEEPQKWD